MSRWRTVRGQHLARVRLEGDHAERRSEFAGARTGRLDQGPMPAVHAVEITDRDHPVQGGLRQAPIAAVNLHGRLMPVLSGKCKGPPRSSKAQSGCPGLWNVPRR